MALPSSGAISMGQVRKELGTSGAISLGSSSVRKLAGRTSGSISMSHLRGKSNNGFNGTIITWQITTGSDVSGVWSKAWGGNTTLPAPYDFYDLTGIWSGDSRGRPNIVVHDAVSWQVMPRKPKMIYLQVENSPAQTTTDCHEDPPTYSIISYFSKNLGGQLQEPNTFINRTIKLGFTF